jgi:hypothetical protein
MMAIETTDDIKMVNAIETSAVFPWSGQVLAQKRETA